jgi:hypothetical protein
MMRKSSLAVFAGLLVSIGLVAVQAHAKQRNLRAFCAAQKNDPGPGEGGQGEVPGLPFDTWRCDNGRVLVCYLGASGRACLRTSAMDADRLREFRRFCREYPGQFIPYALSTGLASAWTCRGTMPTMISTAATDRKNYFRTAWKPLR